MSRPESNAVILERLGTAHGTARSVELGFEFCLKTGNCTVERIQYATSTVSFAILHLRCKMNSLPFRPRSILSLNARASLPGERARARLSPALDPSFQDSSVGVLVLVGDSYWLRYGVLYMYSNTLTHCVLCVF